MKQFITALRKLVIHSKKVILKVGYLIPREGHQTCIKYTNTDEGSIQIINFDINTKDILEITEDRFDAIYETTPTVYITDEDICSKKLCSDYNIEWASVFVYEDEDCICLDRLKFS